MKKSGLFSSPGSHTLIYLEFGYDPQTTLRQAFPQSLFYLFWNRLSSLEQAGTGKIREKIYKIAK